MASTASAQTGMTGIEIFSPLFALLIIYSAAGIISSENYA